jgi:hypothetical protein
LIGERTRPRVSANRTDSSRGELVLAPSPKRFSPCLYPEIDAGEGAGLSTRGTCAPPTTNHARCANSSIVFQSAEVSWSFAEAMFSSRCARDDVPGIGNITGDLCSSQASASCTTLTL